MAAVENEIGKCRCPVCGNAKASLRVSGKQLAYIVCNACNVQAFARSDVSDSLMRSTLVAAPGAPAAEAVPASVPSQAPPAAPPAPVPRPSSSGWGMLRA